jgi:hypothetical protein
MAITAAEKLQFESAAAQQFGIDSILQIASALERAAEEVYTIRNRYGATEDPRYKADALNSLMHAMANIQSNMRLDLLMKAYADLKVIAERQKAAELKAGQ